MPLQLQSSLNHHRIRPSLIEVENLFCRSHTIFFLILLPTARDTSIGPIRKSFLGGILRFRILILLWEVEKSKRAIPYKWELESCEIIRGFQLWPQNLNRITFDLFLAKKLSKTSKIGKNVFLPKRDSNVIRFKL